jgi:hypothetical protein
LRSRDWLLLVPGFRCFIVFFLNGERLVDLPSSYEDLKKVVTDAAK